MDHLRGQVLGRAAERVRLRARAAAASQPLGEAEVNQPDVAVLVQQQVLGLEVTIGHTALLLMQVLEHEHDLGRVEDGRGLVEAAELAQVAEELAAGDVV